MDLFTALLAELAAHSVRFLVIGVAGANYYADGGATLFTTQDRDLFLPPDSDNLLNAWRACEHLGLTLWHGREPLDGPRDRALAERVVEHLVTTRAIDGSGFEADLSLVMAGYDFDTVWLERRVFRIEGVDAPVARLLHIVTSKQAVGREKDRLFLATHRHALEHLIESDEREAED